LRRCLCNRRRVPLKRCILQRFSDFEVSIHFIITHFSSATNSVSSFEGDWCKMQKALASSIPMCVTSIEKKVGRQVLCVVCLSAIAHGEWSW
jgi:hypothetical protein